MALRLSNRHALAAAAFAVVGALGGDALAQPAPGDPPPAQPTTPPPDPEGPTPAPSVSPSATVSTAPVTTPAAEPAKGTPGAPEEDVEAKKAIFFSGDVGFSRGQLGVAPHELGFDSSGANGEVYGLLGGVRFDAIRLGLRWRVHDTTEFSLWTFDASAGYALSMRPITPIFSAHLGYVYDQRVQAGLIRSSIPPGNVVTPNVDLRGALAGIDVAAEYWVTKAIRLGGFIGVDAMFLFRPEVSRPQSLFGPTPTYNQLPLYSETGNTLGLNFNAGVRGEFDIALH